MRKTLLVACDDLETNFRVKHVLQTNQVAFHVKDLIMPGTRERTLLALKDVLGAPNLAVTASIIGKRIGFLGAIFTYAYLHYGMKYTINSNEIACTNSNNSEIWLPHYYLGSVYVCEDTEKINAEWIATNVYGKLFAPIIDSLISVKGLSRKTLLENCYIYMVWIFEKKQVDIAIFHELLKLSAEQFNAGVCHPMRLFNEQQTTRTTCCLNYQLRNEVKHCKSCPLMK
ncbi:(2Fe-2S)-binding protein [Sporosarcina sp. JAI121]|uniref:(2Fe-2S)-binding protein n=1 Tax=Sporosarcina sp. JAI121 TaxID=2723064 RepID=UPI0015C91BAB|nr:(2Fe-2S)-binding protein [Sporosarcina sp. JAI121]NYF26354.1 ferric iron reductase protein FhuF [Sporosarcina sp. JAI121]